MRIFFSPLRTVVFFLAISVIAGTVVSQLQISGSPVPVSSTLSVSFTLPNASPEMIEEEVTAVIEDACSGLSQLRSIHSRSGYNQGTVDLAFDRSANLAYKRMELVTILRQLRPSLPAEMNFPLITGHAGGANNQNPLLVYSISGPVKTFILHKEMEALIRKEFAGWKSIKEIRFSGSGHQQVTVHFKKAACDAFGVTPSSAIDQLRSCFETSYPGMYNAQAAGSYFLHLQNPATTLADIENSLLRTATGATIYLKNIARLSVGEAPQYEYYRINGQPALLLSIYAQPHENRLALIEQIRKKVQQIIRKIPSGFTIRPELDDMQYLREEMYRSALRMGVTVCMLIALMLLVYRKPHHVICLIGGLIVSIGLSILFAWFLQIGIHRYTIAGLAISFGIMLDNSIVMLDHYHKKRNTGIFATLTGATLTTIAAVAIVFFLPEKDRMPLTDLSTMVIIALIASLVTTYLFIPGCYELFAPQRRPRACTTPGTRRWTALRRKAKLKLLYAHTIHTIARYKKTFFALCIGWFGLPLFLLPAKLPGNDWYATCYNAALGNEFYLENIRPFVDRYTGGMLRIFLRNITGIDPFTESPDTKLIVQASLPYGNTLEQMNALLQDFEQYLEGNSAIESYVTHAFNGQQGTIEITFKKDAFDTGVPDAIKLQLVRHSYDLGGVELSVYGMGRSWSGTNHIEIPSYRIVMKGYNYTELERLADLLAGKLRKHNRVQKINTDADHGSGAKSYEYSLLLDFERMAINNTDQFTILNKLQELSAASKPATSIHVGDTDFPVVWDVESRSAYSRFNLLNTPLPLDSGILIRIKDIGKLELEPTSSSIHKENRQYIRMISFEYSGLDRFGQAYLNEILTEMKDHMPDSYSAEKLDINNSLFRARNNYYLPGALLLLVFYICTILSGNFRDPFRIIALIPFAFLGLFTAFSAGDFVFDQGGYAAFIVLGGLTANAAILVISDLKTLRHMRNKRLPDNHLLVNAITGRSRTIFLSTVSISLGLIPFAFGSRVESFWPSFSVGTIGGMAGLLFAIFVVLPVLLWKTGTRR